jgi:hypothetical protein
MVVKTGRENYIDDRAEEIALLLGWNLSEMTESDWGIARIYALVANITHGEATNEHIHDAWSVWTLIFDEPGHPSLIPYADLSATTQALDDVYTEAVNTAARTL